MRIIIGVNIIITITMKTIRVARMIMRLIKAMITTTMIGIIAIVEIITNWKWKEGWWEWRVSRIIRWIITIMKNDKKNRRNKNSMTQDYDYN